VDSALHCGNAVRGIRAIQSTPKENSVTSKCLSGFLILVLSFALCLPAEAQSRNIIAPGSNIGGVTKGEVVGAVVGAVAVVAVVVFVAIHYSKKRSVTGCVNSTQNGMTIADEKDNQVYKIVGNTLGVKPGDRMKLHGKKAKSNGPDKTLAWETESVTKDFGVCRP
jgi:hypothetical protein